VLKVGEWIAWLIWMNINATNGNNNESILSSDGGWGSSYERSLFLESALRVKSSPWTEKPPSHGWAPPYLAISLEWFGRFPLYVGVSARTTNVYSEEVKTLYLSLNSTYGSYILHTYT